MRRNNLHNIVIIGAILATYVSAWWKERVSQKVRLHTNLESSQSLGFCMWAKLTWASHRYETWHECSSTCQQEPQTAQVCFIYIKHAKFHESQSIYIYPYNIHNNTNNLL